MQDGENMDSGNADDEDDHEEDDGDNDKDIKKNYKDD